MAGDTCPFCHTEIDEQLAINGGTCASCFGEIPGEEAPTDPGETVRARQEASDAKHVQRSRIPALLALLAFVGIVGGAGYIVTRPAPEIPILDFDEIDFPDLDIVAAPDDPVEEAVEEVASTHRAVPRQSGIDRLLTRDDVDLAGLGTTGTAGVGGTRGTRQIVGTGEDVAPDQLRIAGPSFGRSTDDAAMMSIQRRHIKGDVLTDDSAIVEMVRGALSAEIPRLQTCYTTQLRTQPDLRGSWVIEFLLNTEGQALEVTVAGQDMQDSALEGCIAGKVREWFFQPIKADLPVRKTVRFRPR